MPDDSPDCVPLKARVWAKSELMIISLVAGENANLVLGKNDWREETITPTQLHSSAQLPVLQSDSHVVVMSVIPFQASHDNSLHLLSFADADKVRECESCRTCFTTQFQMPQLWWSNYAKKSNGHFGCETFRDEYGIVTSLSE